MNKINSCYRCLIELNESNSSMEHIIPNACGGRLKSKSLLCIKCNSKFGNDFDNKLAKTTNELANLLMISRDRGTPQRIRTITSKSREEYYLELGGDLSKMKPNYQIIENDKGGIINVQANNEKKLRQLLNGLARKYPNMDIDKAINSAQANQYYLNESLEIKGIIGGEDVFKSITKTAINYFIHVGGNREEIKHLIPYLEGRKNLEIVWMHYPDKDIYEPSENEVSHVIKLVGNSSERILYAFIELFNTHSFIVKLSESYAGSDLNFDYVYDLQSKKIKNNVTSLKLSRYELISLFVNKDSRPFENVQRKYARVLTIANKIQDEFQRQKVIREAIEGAFKGIDEDQELSLDEIREIGKTVCDAIVPFLVHRLNIDKID